MKNNYSESLCLVYWQFILISNILIVYLLVVVDVFTFVQSDCISYNNNAKEKCWMVWWRM